MQWQGKENKISLQQQATLECAIGELWELMQMPKENYNRAKGTVQCGDDWEVKNIESRDSGELQNKVWKPRRLQPTRNNDSKDFERLQTKVWDPGRHKLKMHNQEIMSSFYFGSLMQEHWLSSSNSTCLG